MHTTAPSLSTRSNPVAAMLTAMMLTAAPAYVVAQPVQALPASTHAGARAPQAAPTNAALVHWRAWELIHPGVAEKVREAYSRDPAWAPDAELTKVLDESQGAIAKTIQASRIPACDWGLDYADGVGMLMPHLGHLRAASRLLLADARRHLATGHADLATDRVAAGIRMATQCRDDGVLISALVSNALAQAAFGEMDVLLASGKASDADRRQLREAIALLDGPDPFGIASSVTRERDIFFEDVVRKLTGPNGPAGVLAEMGVAGDEPKIQEAAALIDVMSRDQVLDEAAKTREEYTAIVRTLAKPDTDPEVVALLDRTASGKLSPLARVLLPDAHRIRMSYAKAEAELARVKALLK